MLQLSAEIRSPQALGVSVAEVQGCFATRVETVQVSEVHTEVTRMLEGPAGPGLCRLCPLCQCQDMAQLAAGFGDDEQNLLQSHSPHGRAQGAVHPPAWPAPALHLQEARPYI